MQPAQLEKLKKLVESSELLTTRERAEWLALLGIMNDKQLYELERILNPAAAMKPEVPNKLDLSADKPVPVESVVTPSSAQSAGLRHAGGGLSKPAPPIQAEPPKPVVHAKQPNRFLQRIKNALSEKDLPTSKPEFQLELEAPKVPAIKPPVPGGPAPVPSKFSHGQAGAMPEKAPSVSELLKKMRPPAEVSGTETRKPALSLKPVTEKPMQPTRPAIPVPAAQNVLKEPLVDSGIEGGTNVDIKDIPRYNPAPKQPKPQPANTPQVVFSKALRSSQENGSVVSPVKPKLQSIGVSRHGTASADFIKTLEDVSKLSARNFTDLDFHALIERLRSLVYSYGYHSVLFQLERSPLYQSYIQTGSILLNDQKSFDKLNNEKRGLNVQYLSKELFEDFIDLLEKIQVS